MGSGVTFRSTRRPLDHHGAEGTAGVIVAVIPPSRAGCRVRAQHIAAIRSYTATAARHDHNILDTLIQAVQGNPWIPVT